MAKQFERGEQKNIHNNCFKVLILKLVQCFDTDGLVAERVANPLQYIL